MDFGEQLEILATLNQTSRPMTDGSPMSKPSLCKELLVLVPDSLKQASKI